MQCLESKNRQGMKSYWNGVSDNFHLLETYSGRYYAECTTYIISRLHAVWEGVHYYTHLTDEKSDAQEG